MRRITLALIIGILLILVLVLIAFLYFSLANPHYKIQEEQKPVVNEQTVIGEEHINYLLNQIGAYNLHNSPLSSDLPRIGVIVDEDKFYSEIDKGNITTTKGENEDVDINIITTRAERNKISEEINLAKKQENEKLASSLIKKAQQIPVEIAEKEQEMQEKDKKRLEILKNLPNILDKSVPIGPAEKNKVIKKYGKTKKEKENDGHAEILESRDLIDTKKASEVAGTRFYYLKRELVRLNHALMDFAMDFLVKKKFTLIQPPYMLRKEILETALTLDAFQDAIYKIENEDLYLIGTAEHALNALYYNEVIPENNLPVRLAGISPCFRKEAGAHGKDTKGIFRVHQFEKIEQFVFCNPKDSWKEFELILNNSIEMFKLLGIPFRAVVLASEDTGRVPCKTIDLEGWFPSQNTYRELGSCSNCLDYQSRRGNTKFQDKQGLHLVHTLNNTAIATERMMTCIIENNLQKNGSIKIPKILWKYTGFKEIKVK